VLLDTTMAPGDFVRWVKQLIDLLDQISVAAAADSPVKATARRSVSALRRGVVAYSAVT
jgi:ATP-dependent RNA helicase HelY